MSVSSASIHLYVDVEVEAEIEAGAIIELQVRWIGRLRTRAVRSLIDGLAVEFLFDPTEDRALIAKLMKVLNKYSPASGHRFARELDDSAAAAALLRREMPRLGD
ncbi:MAG: hypothetical protein VCB77_08070 [Alphaproteobacteria bacterium]